MIRPAVAVLATLLLGVALGGCVTTDHDGAAVAGDRDMLRVGLTANYPPIVFREGGELRGVEVDLAQALAESMDRRLELVELPWEELIPALEAGRFDIIMSGMSVTAGRAERVAFTAAYLEVGQMALIRLADAERFGSLTALVGTNGRVGFVDNTTGAAFVRNNMREAVAVPLSDINSGVAALKTDSIDVFVHDAPSVWRIGAATEHQDLLGLFWPLTQEYLAWAVRKSDDDLLAAVNGHIERWRSDGRLRDTLRRWIPVRVEVR
jgi:polar amino acid transport system substrate-binding protein